MQIKSGAFNQKLTPFSGEINDNEDDEIRQDEIDEYLNKVQEQRAELRNNLRQKFEQLCANGR